jgi:hypothetical protein
VELAAGTSIDGRVVVGHVPRESYGSAKWHDGRNNDNSTICPRLCKSQIRIKNGWKHVLASRICNVVPYTLLESSQSRQ